MTDDAAEDVDIYSDLSAFNYSDVIKKLETSNQELQQQVKTLKLQLSNAVKEKEELKARCETLSNNISSLFKTAQAEIERKNKSIVDLRAEINNVLFRRNKMGNIWNLKIYQEKTEVSLSMNDGRRENEDAKHGSTKDEEENGMSRSSDCKKKYGLTYKDRLRPKRAQISSEVDRRTKSKNKMCLDNEVPEGRRTDGQRNKSDEECSKNNSTRLLSLEGSVKKTHLRTRSGTHNLSSRNQSTSEKVYSVKETNLRTRSAKRDSSRNQSLEKVVLNKCKKQTELNARDQDNSSKEIENKTSVKEIQNKTSNVETENKTAIKETQSKTENNEELLTTACPTNTVSAQASSSLNVAVSNINSKRGSSFCSETSKVPLLTEYSKRMLRRIQGIPSAVSTVKSVVSTSKSSCGVDTVTATKNKKDLTSSVLLSENIVVSSNNSPTLSDSKRPSEPKIVKEDQIVASNCLSKISDEMNCASLSGENQVLTDHSKAVFNVSLDLTLSSSSNSESGESDSFKINRSITSPDLTKTDVASQSSVCRDISNSNEREEAGVVDLKCDNDNVITKNTEKNTSSDLKVAVVNKPVTNDINKVNDAPMLEKGIVETQVEENPCNDSTLSNSDSLHDILNLSGDKNKVTSISYELFSLESIDKLAISPKKLTASEIDDCTSTQKLSNVRENESLNLSENIQDRPQSNLNEVNKNTVESKLGMNQSGNEIIKSNISENKPDGSIKLIKHSHSVQSSSEQKEVENPVESAACKNEMDVVAIVEEGVSSSRNQPTSSNNITTRNKNKKNGFKSIINPISSLWMKNSTNINPKATFRKDEYNFSSNKSTKSEINSKTDLIQSLFGSPVKWADSDSMDFIAPTFEKDSSVFEDSRSCSNGAKVFLKPFEEHLEMNVVATSSPIDSKNSKEKVNHLSLRSNSVKNCSLLSTNNSLSNPINLSSSKVQVSTSVKYEDSTLGQFEDTLQFVSALTTLKQSLSPIRTPEKIDSEQHSSQTSHSFSSVNINQKPPFKIVGPNEKPINILTPRKIPRIISPIKEKPGSSPNSVDSKSIRLSCIDDKAIESVCNLVSSIKETNHRETYLIIPKKSKSIRHNSPKKLLDSSNNVIDKIESTKVPVKLSPVKSPNKTKKNIGGSQKVTKNIIVPDDVPSKKLSPKKKVLLKPSNSLTDKELTCRDNSKKTFGISEVGQKNSRIKLIESLPLIPKTSHYSKVKMTYELKKPSRMNWKKTVSSNKTDEAIVNNEVNNLDNETESGRTGDSFCKTDKFIKSPEVVDDLVKQVQDNLSSGRKPSSKKGSQLLEHDGNSKICDKVEKKSSKKLECPELKSNGNAKSVSLPLAADTMCVTEEVRSLFSKVERPSTNGAVIEFQEKVSSGKQIASQLQSTEASDRFVGEPSKCKKNTLEEFESRKSYNQETVVNIDIRSDKKCRNNKSTESSTVKRSGEPKIKSIVEDGELESSPPKCSNTKTSPIQNSMKHCFNSSNSMSRSRKHMKTSDSHSGRSDRSEENLYPLSHHKSNRKGRRRSYSSESYSSDSDSRGYSRAMYKRERKLYSRRYHSGSYHNFNLSYRRRLSRRYSCYQRREPSILNRRDRSPSRDINRKHNHLCTKEGKMLNDSQSKEKWKNEPSISPPVKSKLNVKDPVIKQVRRSWGSSPVVAVSVSSKCQVSSPLLSEPTYDRINGICCNNIVWKLIEVDGVPECNIIVSKSLQQIIPSVTSTPVSSISGSSGCTFSPSGLVSKKRKITFTSSDVKTESFTSSPKKTHSPVLSTSDQPQLPNVSEKPSTCAEKKPAHSSNDEHPSKSTHNDITLKNKSLSSKKPSSSSDLSQKQDTTKQLKKETNTVSYRVPSFIAKTYEKGIKTVELSKMRDQFTGVFSPSRDAPDGINEQYLENSDFSDQSFSSDESWAPKKKRKKKQN